MNESKTLTVKTPILDVLHEHLDERDPRKQKILVENLLTMSAGLDCDDDNDNSPGNEGLMQSQLKDKDYYHFALNVPMAFEPGAKAIYGSALPNLLGGVIAADRNAWLPEYFRDKFAKPLNIDEYYVPLAPEGQAYMGGGVRLKPRDFMKLGQLMLNGGLWKGMRVVDKAYVEQSTRARYDLNGLHYGYLWWLMKYPYRGGSVEAFAALGNGGQVVLVVPKLSLVFGCVAGNYSDSVFYKIQREWMPKYILPMLLENGR
jgi:CubicO group peptidase (beta-lactamase class C family)